MAACAREYLKRFLKIFGPAAKSRLPRIRPPDICEFLKSCAIFRFCLPESLRGREWDGRRNICGGFALCLQLAAIFRTWPHLAARQAVFAFSGAMRKVFGLETLGGTFRKGVGEVRGGRLAVAKNVGYPEEFRFRKALRAACRYGPPTWGQGKFRRSAFRQGGNPRLEGVVFVIFAQSAEFAAADSRRFANLRSNPRAVCGGLL